MVSLAIVRALFLDVSDVNAFCGALNMFLSGMFVCRPRLPPKQSGDLRMLDRSDVGSASIGLYVVRRKPIKKRVLCLIRELRTRCLYGRLPRIREREMF